MDIWNSAKEVPHLYEWIVAKGYDEDAKEYKYLPNFNTPSTNWENYVRNNNITKWCYIKDIITKWCYIKKI